MSRDTNCTTVVLAYIERDGKVLISLRPPGVPQAGLWEFPGGKVEQGETFPEALQRELCEELGVSVIVGPEIAATCFSYQEGRVALHLLQCQIIAGVPEPRAVAAVSWAPISELATYHFPAANASLLAVIQQISCKQCEEES